MQNVIEVNGVVLPEWGADVATLVQPNGFPVMFYNPEWASDSSYFTVAYPSSALQVLALVTFEKGRMATEADLNTLQANENAMAYKEWKRELWAAQDEEVESYYEEAYAEMMEEAAFDNAFPHIGFASYLGYEGW